jgi:pyochelin synthetase
MSVMNLIVELERAGIRLWEESGQLRFRAPKGVMNPNRRAMLNENKESVINELRLRQETITVLPEPEKLHEPFPLTDVQAAYLFGQHSAFGFGDVNCHMYVELEFDDLQSKRLEDAWNYLIERHEMLRAIFNKEGFQQVLTQVPSYKIQVKDIQRASPEKVEKTIASIRDKMGHRIYNTEKWPLFELVITQSPKQSLLHFSINFIIADWASIQLLLEELDLIYHHQLELLPQIEISFRDYLITERRLRETTRYERDRSYWLNRINQLPDAPELPVLDTSSAKNPTRFRRYSMHLSKEKWTAFCNQATDRKITPSVAVLAAYSEVIGAWSHYQRFTLNLTLLNRLPLHPDTSRLVGDFTSVNLLAVENDYTDSFGNRAVAIGSQLFDDIDHRLYSGVEVMREIARRRDRDAALMPVVFTSAIGLDTRPNDSNFNGAFRMGYGVTQTPQVWIDCQAMDRDGALWLNWDVREAVFPEGLMDAMFDTMQTLIITLATDSRTWDSLAPVKLPRAQSEKRQSINHTQALLPNQLLHEPVLAQAKQTPDRIAVVSHNRCLTYSELIGQASAVSKVLSENGCSKNEIVALVMDKGWEQIVAVIGTLLANSAYLPIDTNQPFLRRQQIVADSKVRFVLSQSWIDTSAFSSMGVNVINVDTLASESWNLTLRNGQVNVHDLAYVIYTSGSTGKPKGVMISHQSAINTILDVNQRFKIGHEDRVLGLANLGFDLSVYDIFGPLSVGGRLILPTSERRSDPSHWVELIGEQKITLWNSVPAQLQMLEHFLDSGTSADLSSLRLALLSGDWIPLTLPDKIRAYLPKLEIISLGGATEAAIWSIYHQIQKIDSSWRSIPYGKPLANQTFHILNKKLQSCPDWTTGEIYIGGKGLAKGYLGDEDKTTKQFITYPFTGERLYRTGDLGRYLPDGTIEFLGREDFQVKMRGHRIELTEIETVLQSHSDVVGAVLIVLDDDVLHRRLVGFVQTNHDQSPDSIELTKYLATQLPEYMLPSQLFILAELPKSNNGKVDRKALQLLAAEKTEMSKGFHEELPGTDLEKRLASLWSEVLDLPQVGRNQDFFKMGGDSLLAAKLVGMMRAQIPEAGGLFFDSLIRQMLPSPTIAALATYLSTQTNIHQEQSPKDRPISPMVNLGKTDQGLVQVLVHDGMGRLAPYQDLVGHLANYGPVLGFSVNEPMSYLRMDHDLLIERRAASYSRLIESHEYDNVNLVGYGLGGLIALEMARYLSENGSRVNGLTLISCYGLQHSLDNQAVETLFDFEFGTEISLLERRDASMFNSSNDEGLLQDVFRQSVNAVITYKESPYFGDITFFRPTDNSRSPLSESNTTQYWEQRCLGDLRIIELEGNHSTCLLNPSVEIVARLISQPRTVKRKALQ